MAHACLAKAVSLNSNTAMKRKINTAGWSKTMQSYLFLVCTNCTKVFHYDVSKIKGFSWERDIQINQSRIHTAKHIFHVLDTSGCNIPLP
jgi:hypothetical protein